MSRRLNNLTVYITAIRDSGSRRRRLEQRELGSRVSHQLRRQLENSVEVDFYTEAPVSVATQVASMVTTLAQSDTKISVAMKGGRTISADPKTLSLPTVTKTPDVDCAGGWSTCSKRCTNIYVVKVLPSGNGARCRLNHGNIVSCTAGEGDCPLPNNGTLSSDASQASVTPTSTAVSLRVILVIAAVVACSVAAMVIVLVCQRRQHSTAQTGSNQQETDLTRSNPGGALRHCDYSEAPKPQVVSERYQPPLPPFAVHSTTAAVLTSEATTTVSSSEATTVLDSSLPSNSTSKQVLPPLPPPRLPLTSPRMTVDAPALPSAARPPRARTPPPRMAVASSSSSSSAAALRGVPPLQPPAQPRPQTPPRLSAGGEGRGLPS